MKMSTSATIGLVISAIIFYAIILGVSFGVISAGVYFICYWFGQAYSWKVSVGIWFIFILGMALDYILNVRKGGA